MRYAPRISISTIRNAWQELVILATNEEIDEGSLLCMPVGIRNYSGYTKASLFSTTPKLVFEYIV
ncbi:unnamed protein product [Sphenostylis stenocarpa]|uniref:Uncharacterized protein n=1 Tax=Sphenostylis stenocarpa TaxID=92480 RepID=A0AA86VWA2_9FABA|nr:unnamed protein product [Sphenostylis stenocarpa]